MRANERLDIVLSNEIPSINQKREAKVLSAFLGLDNALPLAAVGLSWKALGKDGEDFPSTLTPSTPSMGWSLHESSNGII